MLAQVRAEIKSWERDFAQKHGKDPSVQDIRGQPAIAEKYKLYKKLSRATPNHTPPRLPAPKSRPADSVPLPGFNPFSPVKKSTKHDRSSRVSPPPPPNPFATLAKSKPNRTATPSPDPFPFILLPGPNTNASSSRGQSAPTTAVSRARKRLRGEPVSPSPNKPKRQRIRSQVLPPFLRLEQDSSSSDRESDRELPQCAFTSSFVADSPAKAPAGGKSFKLLFDDALPVLSVPKEPVGSSVAQLDSVPHDANSKGTTTRPEHRVNRVQAKLSAQIFPTKDLPVPTHKPTFESVASQVSQPRTSNKRALDGSNLAPSQSQYPLIPPSPPPQDSINRDTGKRKAKATASRKKLRVEDQESDEGADSLGDTTLKVATVRPDRSKHRHPDDLEWDPLPHLGTRNHDPDVEEQIDANHHVSGTFSVDLPDKFRRVLAISPPQNRNCMEERVVRGLLYGGRAGHYDPSRGGDIWGAGETDEGDLGDAETEDDWEGEPVPWEVGDL